MDCSLPGFSIHGIFQARVLEWVAISFSRGSSQPGHWTPVSRIVGRHFTLWTTREAPATKKIKYWLFLQKVDNEYVVIYHLLWGLTAWWLYGGATGDLQKGFYHTLRDPGLLQPESLFPSQATADLCLQRRHSDTQRQAWLSLCRASGSWCAQGFVWALSVSGRYRVWF